MIIANQKDYIVFSASVEEGDFSPLNTALTFPTDSSDGDMVCANVTLLQDSMVECVEEFTVELMLDTNKDSLSLENNSTLITLLDSDCMLWLCLKNC